MSAIENAFDYVSKNKNRFIEELKRIVSFRTVSSSSDTAVEFTNASCYLHTLLREAGFDDIKMISTFGNPVIFAEKFINRKYKTVLFYAHYDVQSAEPLSLWNSDPFVLKVKDGEMYARGVSDDKGMLISIVKAFEAIFKNNLDIKYNVKILFEPCEESCSRELTSMLSECNIDKQKYIDFFSCDTVIACDSSMAFEDKPSITIGIRGCVSFEVTLFGPNRDIHSGSFGGCVGNPIHELCHLISLMHDENNHITISNFYEGVNTTEESKRFCDQYNINEEELKNDLGIKELVYEKGFSPIQSSRIRPTIEVNGIFGGHIGEGGKTIIPSKATAKISVRLVDKQNPRKIISCINSFFEENINIAFRYKISVDSDGSWATVTNTNCEVYKNIVNAIEKEYKQPVINVQIGGSIPVMSVIENVLHCNITFFGTGSPNSNCHGPNEHLSLEAFDRAIKTIIRFLVE